MGKTYAQPPVLHILESRPDWITATARKGDRAVNLYEWGCKLLSNEQEHGGQLKVWGQFGYKGWRCGDVALGSGKEGTIVQTSRETSWKAAGMLADVADHWSRVDYSITACTDRLDFDYARFYYSHLPFAQEPEKSPYDAVLVRRLKGRSTLYVGDRESAFFLRCYDKHAESPDEYAEGCWRVELELKREASELQQIRFKQRQVNREYVTNFVASKCKVWGIELPFAFDQTDVRSGRIHPRKDVDRTLTWFESQVRPAAEFVTSQLGRDRAREALNL